MRQFPAVICQFLILGVVMVALGACGSPSGASPTVSVSPILPTPTTEASSFHDPFAYCAAVGTIDAPDARYIGDKLPDILVQGMIRKGIVTADAPPAIQQNAVWRCMQGHVWICHFGANLPCQEKADTSQAPTAEMTAYCAANPATDSIPAVVTGRATVYAWGCKDGNASIVTASFRVDPQGYLADFWYELVAL
ncbi:MAG: hypothetical protein WCF99_08860 [Chloroflexales bacterium]